MRRFSSSQPETQPGLYLLYWTLCSPRSMKAHIDARISALDTYFD